MSKFLASLRLLQALPPACIPKVADEIKVLTFRPGDILAKEGTPSRGLYILHSGQVSCRTRSVDELQLLGFRAWEVR